MYTYILDNQCIKTNHIRKFVFFEVKIAAYLPLWVFVILFVKIYRIIEDFFKETMINTSELLANIGEVASPMMKELSLEPDLGT